MNEWKVTAWTGGALLVAALLDWAWDTWMEYFRSHKGIKARVSRSEVRRRNVLKTTPMLPFKED